MTVKEIYPFRCFRFFLSLTEIFERELGGKGGFSGGSGVCCAHSLRTYLTTSTQATTAGAINPGVFLSHYRKSLHFRHVHDSPRREE